MTFRAKLMQRKPSLWSSKPPPRLRLPFKRNNCALLSRLITTTTSLPLLKGSQSLLLINSLVAKMKWAGHNKDGIINNVLCN